MTDLNLDRLEALAKNARPFARPGGIDPATVTIPAADLLALIQRTRKFANMLANYGNAINATLPAEVVRQKADAWDEGHADGLHDAHEYREHRKARNPYRPETITRDATGAPVALAGPDAINPPPDPSAAVTGSHNTERTTP